MQSLRCTRSLNRLLANASRTHTRCFGSTSVLLEHASAGMPWFVDPSPSIERKYGQRQLPPHIQPKTGPSSNVPPIPEDTPEVLQYLHSQLALSPHLDLTQLTVSHAIPPPPGPPLPLRLPHGRRKRGGTYAGDSKYDKTGGGLWSWVVIAQVKEGTENRGAIESVVRLVRKSLLKREPPVSLAPKSKHSSGTDWVLVDAGTFAIHILSRAARERYFSQTDQDCSISIMALNDQNMLNQSAKGSNIYPGVANPTSKSGTTDPITSNFVDNPTTPTAGAGAGPHFDGHKQAKRSMKEAAGVCEARPGIIETTNIDPLNENSNKDDGWANCTR